MTGLLPRILCLVVLTDSIAHVQSASDGHLPDITNQTFIDACVKAHNGYRSGVNPAASDMWYMTWDEALAKSARAWARRCTFTHNPFRQMPGKLHPTFSPVGENLWVGESISSFSPDNAVGKWHDEVADFTYSTLVCKPKKMCGHYKQVVWAKSYKVGCAVQVCPHGIEEFSKKKSAIFVCNYHEAGNYKGAHPYRTGAACSDCAGEICEKNLCRDSKRDEARSYSWSPDWDQGATSSASGNAACLAALTTGPLALLLVLTGLSGLQLLDPDLLADD